MQKTALLLAKTDASVSVENLKRYAEYWHMDCDIRQLSWRTIKNRKFTINQLLQFLESKDYDCCGLLELKQYFSAEASAWQLRAL